MDQPQIKQTMQNTLSSDLKIRPEFLGLQTLLSPFAMFCASQRLMMFSSEVAQALVMDGAEYPRVSTGYENIVGKYEFSTCRIDQDMIVRRVIPKFNPITLHDTAMEVPTYTVVAMGMEDREIHSFDVSRYTMLHDGFGYFNKMCGMDGDMNICEGMIIPKGTKLTTSPIHDGNKYMLGTNANVAFLSVWGATEDAFIISKSLAEKGTNTAFHKTKLSFGIDDVPLNLYGDDNEYKCFPSLGESVRKDGVLIALRKQNKITYVSDMTRSSLRDIEELHDETYQAPPGAKVIDVDVYINLDALKKLKEENNKIYEQFIAIHKAHQYYRDAVLDTYQKLCEVEGQPCSDEFNTRVVRAATLSGNREYGCRNVKLYDAREPVEFITVEITWAYKRKVTVGSKLAGRDGSKGVVSAIWPDENMPVDDNGIRADLIMTVPSIINRMNPSQLYEQYWNRIGLQVIRNIKQQWGVTEDPRDWRMYSAFQEHWKEAYDYILEFFNDFRPAYAKFINESLETEQLKCEFVEECLNDGLYLIAAFTEPHPPEDLIKFANKYGVKRTPVTYKVMDSATGELKVVRTKKPVMIGSKYLILLGKIPSSMLSSIEFGYVSQVNLPMKPKSKHIKSQAIIGFTPMRFGEDEICMLTMSLCAPKVARFLGIHALAPSVVTEMAKQLLTRPHPTEMTCLPMKTQEIIEKNQNVGLLTHMFACVGYDVRPRDLSKENLATA